MFFSIMTSISNYERELISERVKSGLEKYRKGKTLGRKSNLTPEVSDNIIKLKSEGVGLKKIAKEFSISAKELLEKVLEEVG